MLSNRARILVVDDTKTNIEILEGILAPYYDIFVALNGAKALELIPKIKPDLVLMDVMMPEMDGYETLRRLKMLPESEDLPVIFLTAKSDINSEKEGLALGAVDYITKPFSPDLVLLRVKNQLNFKQHRDILNEKVEQKTISLRHTLKVVLTSLAALAEYRDNETGAHIRRTQMLVQKIAEALSKKEKYKSIIKSKKDIEFYATAAPLHDIGKVGIQDNILQKPSKLTPEEMEIMKTHTLLGYDVLLHAISDLSEDDNVGDGKRMIEIAANIAVAHHERFDGTGYPKGLKGEAIPLSARIMAVADVYDALVSHRVYKKAESHEQAVTEILTNSGTHFDPDVVEAFIRIAPELPELYKQFENLENKNV